jgi:fluoroacetyl-CoA thioesterase
VPLQPGLCAVVTLVVQETDTAVALGTGDVPVLATPRLVRMAEEATFRAVQGHLVEGTTTVGYRVQVDHLAPVPVGDEVQAEAVLESVESRRLTFRVSVTDARGLVGAGRITRVVVERDRFMERATGS